MMKKETIYYVIALCLFHLYDAAKDIDDAGVDKRNDDASLASVVADVTNLSNQVSSLNAEVTALRNQLTTQQVQLNLLNHVVAFHVYGAWPSNSIITVAPQRPITYGAVTLNIGNGFNLQTSFFTAPISGVYQFHATFMANQDSTGFVHAAIIVQPGQEIALSISDSRNNYFDNTAINAVVHLDAGKTVHVQNIDDKTANYYGGQYLTFSGFLIRAD